jgi:hypothetical protein
VIRYRSLGSARPDVTLHQRPGGTVPPRRASPPSPSAG